MADNIVSPLEARSATREDLEGLQAMESDPSTGLHPVQYYRHQIGDDAVIYSKDHDMRSQESTLAPQYPPPPGSYHRTGTATSQSQPKRVCGLRRTTFWLTLSNVVLLIALVVVAVVESQLIRRDTSASSPVPSNSSQTCNSTTIIPNVDSANICFNTNKPPAASQPLGTAKPDCPNLSTSSRQYTVPGTNLTFLRSCDTDYGGNDMARFPVATMFDCLALCAQLNLYPSSVAGKCKGATWVYGDGPQGTGLSFCYPKNVTLVSERREGTESAALLG